MFVYAETIKMLTISRMSPATTSVDIFACLGRYLSRRYAGVISAEDLPEWFSLVEVGMAMTRWRWSPESFFDTPNLIFLYMLLRSQTAPITSKEELMTGVMARLYVSHCCVGFETGYPLRPFVHNLQCSSEEFWSLCLEITIASSGEMLRINADPAFFVELLTELTDWEGDESP